MTAPKIIGAWTCDGFRNGTPWRYIVRFDDGTAGCVEHDVRAPGAWRWTRGLPDGTRLASGACATTSAAKGACEQARVKKGGAA